MKKAEDLTQLPDVHSVYNPDTKEYDLVNLVTGEVVSSSALTKNMGVWVFSLEYAVAICQAIRKGVTMAAIGRDEKYPPIEVIHMWIRMHPDFKAQVDIARKDRAEGYHDKIIAMAEQLAEPDIEVAAATVASKKTAIDAFKWAAEKNDPDRFGKKQEVTHTNDKPATIVINTGINRNLPDVEDTKYSEVKSE